MPITLSVQYADKEPRSYTFEQQEIKLGRFGAEPASDELELGLDSSISRNHAFIRFVDNQYMICDHKSRNGTFLDETQVLQGEDQPLQVNSVIRLGERTRITVIHIELPPAPEADTVKIDERVIVNISQDHPQIMRDISPPDLHELSTKLASFIDQNTLLESGLEQIVEHIPQIDHCGVLIRRPDGSLPSLATACYPPNDREAFSSTVATKALETNTGFIWKRSSGKPSESTVQFKIKTMMCTPLTTRQGVLGVIYAIKKSGEEPFAERHLKLLIGLSNQIALFLQMQQAYQTRELERYFSPERAKSNHSNVDVLMEGQRDSKGVVMSIQLCGLDEAHHKDIMNRLNETREIIHPVIFEYQGIIFQSTVDRITALFQTNPDSVVKAAQNIRHKFRQFFNAAQQAKIVITMGDVVHGLLASKDYVALGNAVIEATALADHSEPGQIVVSEAVHRLMPELEVLREITVSTQGKQYRALIIAE